MENQGSLDNQQTVAVVTDLMQTLWGIMDHVDDEETVNAVATVLNDMQSQLQSLAQGIAETNLRLAVSIDQGRKAAQAIIRLRDAMRDWRYSTEPRVVHLVDEVSEAVWEDGKAVLKLTAALGLQEEFHHLIFEVLDDIDGFETRHSTAADLANWLVNLDPEELTAEQKAALRALAESVAGVWLDDVE